MGRAFWAKRGAAASLWLDRSSIPLPALARATWVAALRSGPDVLVALGMPSHSAR
jgi:hypothetical protein